MPAFARHDDLTPAMPNLEQLFIHGSIVAAVRIGSHEPVDEPLGIVDHGRVSNNPPRHLLCLQEVDPFVPIMEAGCHDVRLAYIAPAREASPTTRAPTQAGGTCRWTSPPPPRRPPTPIGRHALTLPWCIACSPTT